MFITEEAIELIKTGNYPAHKLSELTGFSVGTIRYNAKKLGISLPKGHSATDFKGKKLDKLTIKERTWQEGKTGTLWKCLCDCGKECVKTSAQLGTGRIKSCGCSSWMKHHNRADVKGNPSARIEWHNIRGGAIRRGYSFELTFSEYLIIAVQNCNYCGEPPSREIKRGNAAYAFIGNGIDRVNNSDGYTLTNSVACCSICNRAKHTLSAEEFREWIRRIKDYEKERTVL